MTFCCFSWETHPLLHLAVLSSLPFEDSFEANGSAKTEMNRGIDSQPDLNSARSQKSFGLSTLPASEYCGDSFSTFGSLVALTERATFDLLKNAHSQCPRVRLIEMPAALPLAYPAMVEVVQRYLLSFATSYVEKSELTLKRSSG